MWKVHSAWPCRWDQLSLSGWCWGRSISQPIPSCSGWGHTCCHGWATWHSTCLLRAFDHGTHKENTGKGPFRLSLCHTDHRGRAIACLTLCGVVILKQRIPKMGSGKILSSGVGCWGCSGLTGWGCVLHQSPVAGPPPEEEWTVAGGWHMIMSIIVLTCSQTELCRCAWVSLLKFTLILTCLCVTVKHSHCKQTHRAE